MDNIDDIASCRHRRELARQEARERSAQIIQDRNDRLLWWWLGTVGSLTVWGLIVKGFML